MEHEEAQISCLYWKIDTAIADRSVPLAVEDLWYLFKINLISIENLKKMS